MYRRFFLKKNKRKNERSVAQRKHRVRQQKVLFDVSPIFKSLFFLPRNNNKINPKKKQTINFYSLHFPFPQFFLLFVCHPIPFRKSFCLFPTDAVFQKTSTKILFFLSPSFFAHHTHHTPFWFFFQLSTTPLNISLFFKTTVWSISLFLFYLSLRFTITISIYILNTVLYKRTA